MPNPSILRLQIRKKLRANALLYRRQFIPEISHPFIKYPSRTEIESQLVAMFNIADSKLIAVFGPRARFGGGQTVGFGVVYDDITSRVSYDARNRVIRVVLGAIHT